MYGMTLDMMAGPTDQARTLQLAQFALADQFYAALNAVDPSLTPDERYNAPTVVAAREAYDASVAELVALLGPNATCKQVDCDLLESFHDIYKDDNGFRPGSGWTLTQVNQYFEQRRAEQAADGAASAASST